MKSTLLPLLLIILLSTPSRASSSCDSLAATLTSFRLQYPDGTNLWTLADFLNDSLGDLHYDSLLGQNIYNTDSYWLAAIQGCGLSFPPIVNCTGVTALMDSFRLHFPLYDSASPVSVWVDYLNEHNAGGDAGGNHWTYAPDQWFILLDACGATSPAPVALASYCDSIHTILEYIPDIGTANVNLNFIIDALDNNVSYAHYDTASSQLVTNNLNYWLGQLRSCGDSCPQILSCDSISAAISDLSGYNVGGGNGLYSLPFAEAYLGIRFPHDNLDTAAWRFFLTCCSPPTVHLGDSVLSHCEQLEYLRILMQYNLPNHPCLPAWVYNYMINQFVPMMPGLTDTSVTQLCTDLTGCKLTCPEPCDEVILTSCDSINSVNYVYKTMLTFEGATVDTGLLDNAYTIMFGQVIPYDAIRSLITNCNNDTAVLTEITYSAQNVSYSSSGGQYYVEFDVFATDTPSNLLFSQGNIFVQYDSTIFGSNLVSRGAIIATKGQAVDSPYYNMALTDSTPNMLKISITHTPNPASLANLDNASQQLCHLKVNLTGFNLTAVAAAFDTIAMAGRSRYQQTPSGLEFPYDIIRINGLAGAVNSCDIDAQLDVTNYTSDLLVFNVQVKSSAGSYFYGANMHISYNTFAFRTDAVSNGDLSCSSSISDYSFTSPTDVSGTNNEFEISIAGTYDIDGQHIDQNDPLPSLPYPTISQFITLATCSLAVKNCCPVSPSGPYLSITSVSADYSTVSIDENSDPNDDNDDWSIVQINTNSYCTGGTLGTYANNSGLCISGAPSISGLDPAYPYPISAGTFSVLTITGSGFGCSTGNVFFKNADDGGLTEMQAQPVDIKSWSDNEIKVWVPSAESTNQLKAAGSGPVRIETSAGSSATSTGISINVPYAVTNGRNGTNLYPTPFALLNENSAGGITFTPTSDFTNNATLSSLNAISVLNQAMQDWKCETGVNFVMGSQASVSVNANDATNSILFDDLSNYPGIPDDAGAITFIQTVRLCSGSTPSLCAGLDIDIVFDQSLINQSNSNSWNFDPAVPSNGNPPFIQAARHEFGHAHGLSHAQPSQVMYYELNNYGFPRSLQSDDIDGGKFILTTLVSNYGGSGCYGHGYNQQNFPTSGCNGTNAVANLAPLPYQLSVYPNPFSDNLTVKAECGSLNAEVRIQLVNDLGQIVQAMEMGKQNGAFERIIDVSSIADGTYIVKVKIGDFSQSMKFVKMN